MINEENESRFSAINTYLETNLKTLNQYVELKNKIIKEHRETGLLFNPLRFFNIGETKHSLNLAH